jgi:Tol biopolymer transport system component
MAVPASGGVPQEVSHEGVQSEGSVWAPDGDRVAYVAYRPQGGFDIWIRSLSRPQERRYVVGDKPVVWPVFWSPDGRELVLARMSGSKYAYSAFDLGSGRETRIGRSVPLPSGRGDYVELNAQGEKFRDLFYPGGEGVFADGKDTSDIYLLKVRGLLEARLLAAAGE